MPGLVPGILRSNSQLPRMQTVIPAKAGIQ